jgi:hypothetical protein
MSNPVAQTVIRFDVTPDGQCFLLNMQNQGEVSAPEAITVVLNWPAGVKK